LFVVIPVRAKRDSAVAGHKPALIDTCHAYRSDGPLVEQRWPEHYTGPHS